MCRECVSKSDICAHKVFSLDYFNNVLTNFLGLEPVGYVAVYAGTKSLICVPNMNKGLMGLEQHEGE